ncbi:hypothetical protein BVG81_008700, partial [Haliangium sp. UPWRP_2]
PGVTLSEVCRKHRVSPDLVYRWRAVAQQATTLVPPIGVPAALSGARPASQPAP